MLRRRSGRHDNLWRAGMPFVQCFLEVLDGRTKLLEVGAERLMQTSCCKLLYYVDLGC